MDGPDASPGTDRLASDRPDNFKIAARPDLPTPEWPNVLAGLGSSGLALRRVAFGRWQAGGQAGSLSSLSGKLLPCAACEYSWGHTLHVCASCPALPAGADLCPFRKPERESLGHVRGRVVTGKQRCYPIMTDMGGGGRFETLGGNGRFAQESAHIYSRYAPSPGSLSRRPSRRPSLCTVVPRRSTQRKVHASTLVPISPLSQRLPLLVRCCQI